MRLVVLVKQIKRYFCLNNNKKEWGVKKLDTSAFACIIDSMFKKLKDLWKKILNKSDDFGQEYMDYEYEDKYIQQLNSAMDNNINNKKEKENGNLE